jgi:mRNA interferase RelE/StbE
MPYAVIYRKEALRVLRKIPPKIAALIQQKIEVVAQAPYAKNANVTRLQGRDGYRLRVGDWRVIYDIIDAQLVIDVVRIAARGSAYKE